MNEFGCFSDGDLLIFLSQLIASFGLRKPFESFSVRESFSKGALGEVIRKIKWQYNLSCRLRAIYVEGDVYKYLVNTKLIDEALKSQMLADIRKGIHNPAITLSSNYVPMYGSEAFKQVMFALVIDVTVFKYRPFEVFAYAMAHEMSHILLNCVHHPLKNIEAAADITTMVFGFSEIYCQGFRHGDSELGYLTARQVMLIYDEIKRLLK